MKAKRTGAILKVLVAMTIGASGVSAKTKEPQQVPLTEVGKQLEDVYANQLESLKKEISKELTAVDERRKSAYLKAREEETAAEVRVEAAKKRQGEIGRAKALVAHAKGKWIGGADKGI